MRDYKKEYARYQGKPEQIKRRSARNQARRKAIRLGKARKGDGKDVHHRDNNPNNNGAGNLSVTSVAKNRGYPRDRNNKPKKGLSNLAARIENLIEFALPKLKFGTVKRVLKEAKSKTKTDTFRKADRHVEASHVPPFPGSVGALKSMGVKANKGRGAVIVPRGSSPTRLRYSKKLEGLMGGPANTSVHEHGHALDRQLPRRAAAMWKMGKKAEAIAKRQQKRLGDNVVIPKSKRNAVDEAEAARIQSRFTKSVLGKSSLIIEKRANKNALNLVQKHGGKSEAKKWKTIAKRQMHKGYREPLFRIGMVQKGFKGDSPTLSEGKNFLRGEGKWLRRKQWDLAARIENLIEFSAKWRKVIEFTSLGTTKKVLKALRDKSHKIHNQEVSVYRPKGAGSFYVPKAKKLSLVGGLKEADDREAVSNILKITRKSKTRGPKGKAKVANDNSVIVPRGEAPKRIFPWASPKTMGMHETGHAADPHAYKGAQALKNFARRRPWATYGKMKQSRRLTLRMEKRANQNVLKEIKKHGSKSEVAEWKKTANKQMKIGYRTPFYDTLVKDQRAMTKAGLRSAERGRYDTPPRSTPLKPTLSQGKKVLRENPWLRKKWSELSARIENLNELSYGMSKLKRANAAIQKRIKKENRRVKNWKWIDKENHMRAFKKQFNGFYQKADYKRASSQKRLMAKAWAEASK